jgi:N-methylhydantoinase A
LTVPERLDARGEPLADLDPADARTAAREVAATGADSVAVCLLFAFEDDAHERAVAGAIREETDAAVSVSSDVLPEIREYERTVATALNAALKPTMDRYVGRLVEGVEDAAEPVVMGSNGGLMAAADARERPVETLLSGPAAGVRGAAHVAERAGFTDLITMDMGGTSCDVSLVEGGEAATTTEAAVGGYPVGVPAVDIHTVGAGGGSVAAVDAGGALRVGPESAGADPGPVCYGRGGERPTTTDAHAVLGRIDPGRFLADPAPLERVRAAFEPLAERIGVTVEEAAEGVLDVANASTERALRVVSVERGRDPRGYTLVAFGGAGPLHAPALARSLAVPRVLVPRAAGVLSALGLLAADLRYDRSRSRVRPWGEVTAAGLDEVFGTLRERAEPRLADAGVPPERRRFERALDLRYVGQSFELTVPAEPVDGVVDRFHAAHERRYGHADPGEPVELVTVRLRARGVVEPPELDPAPADGSVADAAVETRRARFDGEDRETTVYDRERLPAGGTFAGPAVVAGPASTLAVPPGDRVEVDDVGNLVVEVGGDG